MRVTTDFSSFLTTIGTNEAVSPYFVPPVCVNSSYIGQFCNISIKPCDILELCRNSGNCTDDPNLLPGYYCTCEPGFSGHDCELDTRLCKSNTCLHYGSCTELNSTDFHCNCTPGRTGLHCELLVDYCHNATCLNKGICRLLLLDYKCECLFGSSGRHCEHVATSIVIRQYISKGFGYVAIIALSTVAGFIVVLDILKYFFGIDPVRQERDQIRRRRVALEQEDRENRKPENTLRVRRVNKVLPSS